MVTGRVEFRTRGGNVQPAESVVYVVDANTGNFAAYLLPWNSAAASFNFTQMTPMVLLGKGTARNFEIRE